MDCRRNSAAGRHVHAGRQQGKDRVPRSCRARLAALAVQKSRRARWADALLAAIIRTGSGVCVGWGRQVAGRPCPMLLR